MTYLHQGPTARTASACGTDVRSAAHTGVGQAVTGECGVEQAATYKSDQASRDDLNAYYDNQNNVAHKAHKQHFTSAAAKQQLDSIFSNSNSDKMNNKVRKIQKKSVSAAPNLHTTTSLHGPTTVCVT